MADRSAAEAFGKVFTYLAKLHKQENINHDDIKKMADWLYEESRHGDFCAEQMEAFEALKQFGFASVDPNVNDGYPVYKD